MVSTYDCDSNDCSIGMDGCDGWSVEVRMGSGRGKRVTKVALVGEDGTWRRRAMTAKAWTRFPRDRRYSG